MDLPRASTIAARVSDPFATVSETFVRRSEPLARVSETFEAISETNDRHDASRVAHPPADMMFAPRIKKVRRQNRSRGWMRSRDREQLQLQSLQLDVNDLRQEIESLRRLRTLLYSRVLHQRDAIDGAYVHTVRQYYDMVHNGYHDVMWPRDGGGPVSGREYFAAIMDPDMRMGRLAGLEQFIGMWKRYTQSFRGLEFEMVDARLLHPDQVVDDAPVEVVVVADSRFECSISHDGIPLVFPHLLHRPAICRRLMGQILRGNGQFTIAFNARTHRVVSFDMSLDVVGALLRALGDPELVTKVLSGALITADCCIGDLGAFESSHPAIKSWAPSRPMTTNGRLVDETLL